MRKLKCVIALLLVFSVFSPFITKAETSVCYMPVEFSHSFNAKVFAVGGNEISDFSDPLNYIGAYKQLDGEWTPVTERALNKTAFDATKDTEGLIYSLGNIPFDVNTEGGLAFGGRSNPMEAVTADLKGIVADKLHILMPVTKGVDKTKTYKINILYKDGTKEEISFVFTGITYMEIEGGVAVNNSYIKDASGTVDQNLRYYDVISIETNIGKVIEEIKFYTDDRYGGFAVIGITAEFPKNSFESYKSVFNADAIYNSAAKQEEKITFAEILEKSFISNEDFMQKLSGYTTGKYLFSLGKETEKDVDPYTSPLHNSEYMLNLDIITQKLDENYCLSTSLSDYDLSHLNEKYRAVYVNKGLRLYPDSNYYKTINFIAFNNKNTDISDFPIKITYDDGSYDIRNITLYQGNGNLSEDKVNKMLFNTGRVHADILWASLGETTTGSNQVLPPVVSAPTTDNKGMGYIYEYSVPVSQNKRVISVEIGQEGKPCYLLGITYSIAEINEEILQKEIESISNEDIENNSAYEKMFYISGLINNAENIQVPQKYYDILDNLEEKFDGEIIYTISNFDLISKLVNQNRKLLDNGADIRFNILPGEYKITSPVVINSTSSSNGTGKVIISTENKDTVSISGSISIDKELFSLVKDTNPRIREENRDKIYVAQLDLPISIANKTRYIGYINLIKDDKTLPIASYPNRGYAHFEHITQTGDGFYYTDNPQYDWSSAKDVMVEGYLSNDYGYEITAGEIDAENKIIKLKDSTASDKYKNRRYRLTNILEELDSVGEWYFDKGSSKLYYMPETVKDLENLQLAYFDDNLIKIYDAKNVVIENITFKNSRGDAIRVSDSNNIIIKGCMFYNLSVWSTYVTNSTNVIFEENIIRDTASGITVSGGDYENLIPSGNVIRNNLMYNIGWYSGYGRNIPIVLNDVGGKVVNNTAYNLPFHAINYFGNDNLIAYNELYDLCNETNDVAAIYSNGKYYERGSQICYNYIHDIDHSYNFAEYEPETTWSFNGVQCVYLDNALNEQSVHHNIFKDVLGGINVNCGQYNDVFSNTMINTKHESVNVTSYDSGGSERVASFTADYQEKKDNESYNKYNGFVNPADTNYAGRPAYNKVNDNLIINGSLVYTQENVTYFGNFENNMITETTEEINQYGLLNSLSETAKGNPQLLTDVNFDVLRFGITDEFAEEVQNRFDLKTKVIQNNNSFDFVVDDEFKIGNYEIYIEGNKIGTANTNLKVNSLPNYGNVTFETVPLSKGLKIKGVKYKKSEFLSEHKISEFYLLDENGREIENINDYRGKTVKLTGCINNFDNKGKVFISIYGKNQMLMLKEITGNIDIQVPNKEIQAIKIFIWDMEVLFPYDDVYIIKERGVIK